MPINRTLKDLRYWRNHLLRFEKRNQKEQAELALHMINFYLDKLSAEKRLLS